MIAALPWPLTAGSWTARFGSITMTAPSCQIPTLEPIETWPSLAMSVLPSLSTWDPLQRRGNPVPSWITITTVCLPLPSGALLTSPGWGNSGKEKSRPLRRDLFHSVVIVGFSFYVSSKNRSEKHCLPTHGFEISHNKVTMTTPSSLLSRRCCCWTTTESRYLLTSSIQFWSIFPTTAKPEQLRSLSIVWAPSDMTRE
jgi:hypothetical protein